MVKYGTEFKLEIVESVLAGEGAHRSPDAIQSAAWLRPEPSALRACRTPRDGVRRSALRASCFAARSTASHADSSHFGHAVARRRKVHQAVLTSRAN